MLNVKNVRLNAWLKLKQSCWPWALLNFKMKEG